MNAMPIRLLDRLQMTRPIVQAPMAGVSTPALAAAVSNEGGLGSLGIGAMNVETARKTLRETRALTSRPFNVNVFCHRPARVDADVNRHWTEWLAPRFAQFGVQPPASLKEIYVSFVDDAAMLAMLIEERPAVVSFHFGLPPQAAIDALHAADILLFATATNPDEAAQAVAAGVDALVAQGIEGGGHRGVFDPDARDPLLGTFALTRLLATRFDVPVVAAGGIMDGAGIAAALALGAQAAQLGTAFVASPETAIDDGYRRALIGDGARLTTFTSAISGRMARGLVNRFTELGELADKPAVPAYPVAYDAGKALNAAAKAHGEAGYGAQWAGQAATLARALPAAELVRTLQRETEAALADLRARIAG
ncbi:nitronate monooxygenase [Paraburkholderia sp. Ac-20340]|uniref:NAD(P)H-dependent flavin oxidoreductase n=1 Tax=Paraburkholderia sp. Ac-20340 TaxID=2703888 RepID=UPI00197F9387|nr:nitronate monooxygenase [Paraburkholderia sp. Ac-20340]MBN3858774.1 nitronate monooxygenase [Paraburkholderia sp. Ac-20340]